MAAIYRDYKVFICSIFLLFYSFPSKCCYAIHNITEFQPLSLGNTLVSPTKIFELGFFTPNKSSNRYVGIWYARISPQKVVWVANRENPLRATDFGATLTIRSDRNLNILDGNNNSVWSTKVQSDPSNSSVAAVLSDQGNFILTDGKTGAELWQSFDHLGDTFLPGSRIGYNLKTNESYTLTSWRSENDPTLGTFVLGVSAQIPPEVFIWINGSIPYWRSGPWDQYKFTGIPDMDTGYFGDFSLVQDLQKGSSYLNYKYFGSDDLSFLFLSSKGDLSLIDIIDDEGVWHNEGWHALQSQCALYGVCGNFGVCDDSVSPICKCLKGFEPKLVSEWSRGNWKQGCVRQKKLGYTCSGNTSSSKADRFENIRKVKPPDFYDALASGPEDCPWFCLMNCSCVAYAYIEGIGCLIWSEYLIDIQKFSVGGEKLFLRLADEETNENVGVAIIISLVAVFTCGIICAIAIAFYRHRARKKDHADSIRHSSRDSLQVSDLPDPTELPIFDFHTISIATNHFSLMNKLGQGGFGPVYKGKLQDGRDIAVKRLSSSSGQGIREFKNEMILISKLQHRNLVKLFGYCVEREEKLLVYEFMPNKSLDCFIFDPRRCTQVDWASRLNIIHGIARGLLYLHRDSCLRVIHRDLKVSNILLDEKMNPKISDFGLARIFQGTLDLANTQRVVGTLGYMSPEYAMGGIFSEKSDVFSFGVLILEIMSGKKNTNFHYCDQQLSLIAYAWQLWSEKREVEFVDEALADSRFDSEVRQCIQIGLLCVQDHAVDRPTMPEVVLMLSNETNRPKPKQPMFTLRSTTREDLQSKSDGKFSANEDTMSLVEGR